MARTPSMTRAECEARIGPRGALKVTVENRREVRKWIVACGGSSAMAGGMSLYDLGRVYNDVTDTTLRGFMMPTPAPRPETPAPSPTKGDIDRIRGTLQWRKALADPTRMMAGCPFRHSANVAAWNYLVSEYKRDQLKNLTKEQENVQQPAPAPSIERVETRPRPEPQDDMSAKLAALQALLTPQINRAEIEEIARETARAENMTPEAIQAYILKTIPDAIPVYRLEIKKDGVVRDLGEKPRHKQLPELLRKIQGGIPTMIIGPAGSGKTTAAEQVAEALECDFYIQGATTGTHELLGFVDGHGRYQTTPFRDCFEKGGLICLDEIDAGDPGAILVMNAALANGHMAFPDHAKPVKRHESFRVVACANTFGHGADRQYVGRNQLDAATLDRFARIHWRYDEKLERMIAGNDSWVDRVQALRASAEREKARLVISPRASIFGAREMALGATRAECEDSYIFAGIDADTRSRIEKGAK